MLPLILKNLELLDQLTLMDERNLDRAFAKIEFLDKRITVIETESRLQFKELFVRLKRIEGILVGAASAIIILLSSILWGLN